MSKQITVPLGIRRKAGGKESLKTRYVFVWGKASFPRILNSQGTIMVKTRARALPWFFNVRTSDHHAEIRIKSRAQPATIEPEKLVSILSNWWFVETSFSMIMLEWRSPRKTQKMNNVEVCPFLGCIFDHPKGHTVASQRMKLLPGW
jgi:hypothetical protein